MKNLDLVISTATPEDADRSGTKKAPRLLTHIQALRAIAVLLVVLYHLWPNRLSGGYVGVDVFFVISGYLMTSHVLRGAASGRTIRAGLNDFYLRRIRRILPASLFVLFVIAVITLAFISRVEWEQYLRQIVASTLYVENWSLAFGSTDYLAAGVGASPVQHFWSLSVEEQFYLIWPVLLLLTWAAAGVAHRRRAVIGLVALLVVVSLAYSVLATASDPKFAYFDTFARLWEFGVGGVLAVLPALIVRNRALAAIVSYAGLLAIGISALLYSATTSFPGYAAILPVVGTAAVIAAGQDGSAWGPQNTFALRPVQFIGNVSYSMYLWHWPLIVLAPALLGIPLSTPFKMCIFAATILLAWLSKRFLEDPFRVGFGRRRSGGENRQQKSWHTYLAALCGMAVIVSLAGIGWVSISGPMTQARTALAETSRTTPACFGAEVLSNSPACADGPSLTQVVPDPLVAVEDFPYDVCQQRASRSDVITCQFGTTENPSRSIALIGDSHATQWLPALIAVADERHWSITTYLMSGCAFADTDEQNKCSTWNASVRDRLSSEHFDAVVVSARGAASLADDGGATAANIAKAWQGVIDQGSSVIALRDVPQAENAGIRNIPQCVFDKSPEQCEFSEAAAERFDLVPQAAAMVPQAQVVDMSPSFCTDGTCGAVIGSVLVYLDGNHMTATYSRSLKDALGVELAKIGF